MTKWTEQINWQSVRVMVLDLDGTIYDKRHLALCIALRQWKNLRRLLVERCVRKQMQGQCFGDSASFYQDFFARIAQGCGATSEQVEQWYRCDYLPSMVEEIGRVCAPRREIIEMLEQCRERGVKVVVYSDYEQAKDKLRALDVDTDWFAEIVSAPELGGLKPSRSVVERLLRKLEVLPEECLFVGDRDDTDGASARGVGAEYIII